MAFSLEKDDMLPQVIEADSHLTQYLRETELVSEIRKSSLVISQDLQ